MLFTVFVERLLLSAPLGTTNTNHYAIAVQLLDYPLIVVRPSPAGDAAAAHAQQDIVHFRRGTAAVLDANEQELDFLVSHVGYLTCRAATDTAAHCTLAECCCANASILPAALNHCCVALRILASLQHCEPHSQRWTRSFHYRYPPQPCCWMSACSCSSLPSLQQALCHYRHVALGHTSCLCRHCAAKP
jgi:hypothetical protein